MNLINEPNKGYWKETEHKKFLEALFLFGTKWKEGQKYISTRNVKQAKSHSQKFFSSLRRKFLKATIKESRGLMRPDFALVWTLNYIKESFLPLVEVKLSKNLDVSKHFDRLVKIFVGKLDLTRDHLMTKKVEKKKLCYCRRVGNKICDCLYGCCSDMKKEKEILLNVFKPPPIFKIEKVPRRYQKIPATNEFNGKFMNNILNEPEILFEISDNQVINFDSSGLKRKYDTNDIYNLDDKKNEELLSNVDLLSLPGTVFPLTHYSRHPEYDNLSIFNNKFSLSNKKDHEYDYKDFFVTQELDLN